MLEPTITGNFNASGGSGNDIQAIIADEMNFTNWINGHQAGVFVQDVEIGGAIFERAALRGQYLADEEVPWRVGGDVVANPVVIRPHRRSFQFPALDQQQVGAPVSPVIHELGPPQQRVDELVAGGGGRGGVLE